MIIIEILISQLKLQASMDVKPRISNDSDKNKMWKLADIADPAHVKALRLPDSVATSSKVYC